MINLDDIKGHSALSLLETYSGINPYLKKMRNDYLKNKKIQLTETQVKYIIDNHQKEPILINRIIQLFIIQLTKRGPITKLFEQINCLPSSVCSQLLNLNQ